jgi:hypothetical protein
MTELRSVVEVSFSGLSGLNNDGSREETETHADMKISGFLPDHCPVGSMSDPSR